MKNKKNLLIYPKNINFEFLGLEFMRLHKHGQGIISRSRCSHSIEKHGFPFIIDKYLSEDFNNFQLTDFMFLRATGFHGPFSSKFLSSKDFEQLDSKKIKKKLLRVLKKNRTNTPEISEEVLTRLKYFIDVIFNRKTICFFLNRLISDEKNKIKFEHEWSHALNEYHEFIIFSLEANECFSIILAYD